MFNVSETNLDVTTTDDAYNDFLVESISTVDPSFAGALLSTEGPLKNDEPVPFVYEPSNVTSVLTEEQVPTTVVTVEDVTGFAEGLIIDPTAEESLEDSTATPSSETSVGLLETPPMPAESNTTGFID